MPYCIRNLRKFTRECASCCTPLVKLSLHTIGERHCAISCRASAAEGTPQRSASSAFRFHGAGCPAPPPCRPASDDMAYSCNPCGESLLQL